MLEGRCRKRKGPFFIIALLGKRVELIKIIVGIYCMVGIYINTQSISEKLFFSVTSASIDWLRRKKKAHFHKRVELHSLHEKQFLRVMGWTRVIPEVSQQKPYVELKFIHEGDQLFAAFLCS